MLIVRAAVVACSLVACSASALVACVGPTLVVQQYAGPARPKESIAVFRMNGRESIMLVELDREEIGVPIASDSRLHIELLPGRHTLTVQNGSSMRAMASLAFDAEAGKTYRVLYVKASDDTESRARVYEVDASADTPLRDVTATTDSGRSWIAPKRRTLDAVSPEPTPSDDAAAPATSTTSDASVAADAG